MNERFKDWLKGSRKILIFSGPIVRRGVWPGVVEGGVAGGGWEGCGQGWLRGIAMPSLNNSVSSTPKKQWLFFSWLYPNVKMYNPEFCNPFYPFVYFLKHQKLIVFATIYAFHTTKKTVDLKFQANIKIGGRVAYSGSDSFFRGFPKTSFRTTFKAYTLNKIYFSQ